ncbi:MAG: hypothetical protein ACR5K4_00040 [Sodalis sp. (in: enterobacteria)]
MKKQEHSIACLTHAPQNAQCSLETMKDDIDKLTHSIYRLQDRQAEQRKIMAEQLVAAFVKDSILDCI